MKESDFVAEAEVPGVDYGRFLALRLDANDKQPTATRTEEIRIRIVDDITSGRIPPGTRLDELQLAERFEVSRTPVREALKQLNTIGLVMRGTRRTMTVVKISPYQLRELFEVMGELEVSCVRLAASRMTGAERGRLEQQHEVCRVCMQKGDAGGYGKENAMFHGIIYAGTHNACLADATHQVRVRLSPYRRAQFNTPDRMTQSCAEHEFILRAILRGDQVTAANVMRDHIIAAEEAYTIFAANVKSADDYVA